MRMGRIEKFFVNSPSHSKRVSRHAEKMLRFTTVRPHQRYLDVGCGNGAAAIHMAKIHHLNATGVDVDPGEIRAAQQSAQGIANVEFRTADGSQLPFSDGEFDIVATNKVTHHIASWEAAVKEMVRVLKPNGYLIYTDLVFPGWLAAVGKRVVKEMGFPTAGALEQLVKENNLATVHLSKFLLHYEAVWRKKP